MQILENLPPGQLIDSNLLLQTIFTFCYDISSLFLMSNKYAGFNVGFLGFIYGGFIFVTYRGIRKTINRTNYGG